MLQSYEAHTKKITCIYYKELSAILTTSDDGTLRVTSLCSDFSNWTVDPKEMELSCFCLRASTFNASQFELFIGTQTGKMFYYYSGLLQN